MPIAKGMISKDVDEGIKALEFTDALFTDQGDFSQIQLAQIESVMYTGTMPPRRYAVMHWDSSVSKDDNDNVRSWMKNVREQKFASPNVAKAFAGEVVQPIDRHKFKVPMLRNLAVTYPYFHDGQAKTLTDAIEKMAIYQHGKPLKTGQVKDIEKFLLTLTGEYNGKPLAE